jgi:cytoskeletal protein RodZ
MSSVGETLRRERLRKEFTLEQISRETKISTRMLDAIEKEHFEMLPGGVFAKSFVRQYARFLGLDEEELAAEAEKAIHPASELPAFATQPAQPVFKVPRIGDWQGGGRSNSMLPALALVVGVMVVCSAVYAWWQRSRRPSPPPRTVHAAQKAVETPAPKPVVPAPATPAATNEAVNEAAAPPKTETPQTETTPPVNPAAALHVSLTASADTWIQAWADGKTVIVGVLPANGVKTVQAAEAIRIRTGNAGDLQVTVNGKPAGPLGPKGQVRTLEITPDRIQILPPPPKPAPAAPEPL